MADFPVEIQDQAVIARIDTANARVRANLTREVQSLAFDIQGLVKGKLSGDVLNVVTGNLRAHVLEEVTSTNDQVLAQVFVSGVKYASPHEFGGAGYYTIAPTTGKVLHWLAGGQDVFARLVNHPPAKERSYMRSTLRENRDVIIERMKAVTVGSI